jgi:hypothetical protein
MQGAGTLALAAAMPGLMMEPEAPVIDADLHTRLVEDFESAEDASRTNREKAERDVDYYDNKQLTEQEFKALRRRGQPPISLNMIRQKVDFLLGLERSQRTKPKALPRTPVHEQDAAAVGDALQFVCDDNRYNQVRSKVWEDVLKAGWGGTELSVEDTQSRSAGAPSKRIIERRCSWDRMFWDPYTSEDDFSDASYLGMVLWMDRTAAVRTYGEEAGKVFDETVQTAQVGGTYDDRPKLTTWIMTGSRQRVRVVQMYRLGDDGEWEYWEFTKGGILKGGPSPWLDEHGGRTHAYEWMSAYVDRDNNRYGVIRDMIDPQDEINKRRSKALHHFTSRQTFGTPEAMGGMSIADMKRELAKPDGHVPMPPQAEWGKNFGVIPTNDQAAGHFELLNQVMQVFETMGPNASMQGKGGKEQSGRAILANQQGGMTQLGSLTDDLRDMDYRTYRKIWNAIRQFWTGETWVRVTDDEKNLKWVGLNTPKMVPVMQPAMQGMGDMGQPAAGGEQGQPVMDPATGKPMMRPVMDPMTGQPVMQNVVSELDVDIIIEDAPDMGTLASEQFQMLVQLKQMDTQNEIPFKAIIKAAPNLRQKDEMLKMIEDRENAPPPQPNPIELAGAQAKLANVDADTANKASLAKKHEADAAKTVIEATHTEAAAQVRAMHGSDPVPLPPAAPQQLQPFVAPTAAPLIPAQGYLPA